MAAQSWKLMMDHDILIYRTMTSLFTEV